KLESRFSRSISQGGNPAMILVGTPVETDLTDTDGRCSLTDGFADRRGRLGVSTILDGARELLVLCRSRSQGAARRVVDHLHADVTMTPRHRQPRSFAGASNPFTNAEFPPRTLLENCAIVFHDSCSLAIVAAYLAPVLPALRRTCSPSYRIPFPL